LELFHGPTAAFKDFGARFLARAMERLEGRAADPLADPASAAGMVSRGGPLTILVATSGDTGGAVAAAFHRRPGLAVRVLFPQGAVSPRQKRQLTCWGDNVSSYEVRGNFDDCQRLVKAAFRDESLARRYRLSSANSINLGRLLPQMAYYVHASALYRAERGVPPSLVIPSGNLGNALGAFWARAMGAPIDRIVMASNANRALPDYFSEGAYRPRPSIPTIANAMDVGDPSNMERLRALYPGFEALKAGAAAYSVGDQELRAQIRRRWERSGYLICPHTAAADRVYEAHLAGQAAIVVATAHPAKFETVVEPLIGSAVPVPPALQALLDAPSVYKTVDPELSALFPG
jgi:threonine synthase